MNDRRDLVTDNRHIMIALSSSTDKHWQLQKSHMAPASLHHNDKSSKATKITHPNEDCAMRRLATTKKKLWDEGIADEIMWAWIRIRSSSDVDAGEN